MLKIVNILIKAVNHFFFEIKHLLNKEKSKDGLGRTLLKINILGRYMTICIAILNFSLNTAIMGMVIG